VFSETSFLAKNETSYFNFTTACTHISTNKNLVVSKNLLATNNETEISDLVKAKRLKISGAVFTAIGGAGLLGSALLTGVLVHSYKKENNSNIDLTGLLIAIPLFYGVLPSTAMLTIGLPQLGVGIHKTKKYKKLISK
jgi:hypothetical protein